VYTSKRFVTLSFTICVYETCCPQGDSYFALKEYYYYYLTAIGLTPDGSSIHLHTNSTQTREDETHITIKRGKNYKEKMVSKRKKLGSTHTSRISFGKSCRIIDKRIK
jgi:hypothetical protein